MCQHGARILGAEGDSLWCCSPRKGTALQSLWMLGSSWELGLVLPCLCRQVEPPWELLQLLKQLSRA